MNLEVDHQIECGGYEAGTHLLAVLVCNYFPFRCTCVRTKDDAILEYATDNSGASAGSFGQWETLLS